MSTLTPEQIAEHAYKAGFRGDALATAVAVAMAESHGNTNAHNAKPPDNSYGLWQVNMLGSMGPARRREFGLDSNDDLFNADENAKAAYAISNHGKDFSPWTTYTGGAYKDNLAAARKAADKVTAEHKKPSRTSDKKNDGKDNSRSSKGKDGFTADPAQFSAYTNKVDDVANELRSVGSRTVHAVTSIAPDSFGDVGKETGFSAALSDFGKSLEQQVSATGKNARALGSEVAAAAKAYQANEDEVAAMIKSTDITSVLG